MIKDYLFFRRMLIPFLVEFIFWLGILAAIASGILDIYRGLVIPGLIVIILGPLVIRMICEYIIVLFRINDTLTDIKELMEARLSTLPVTPVSPVVHVEIKDNTPPSGTGL